jgi:hypothetical protein
VYIAVKTTQEVPADHDYAKPNYTTTLPDIPSAILLTNSPMLEIAYVVQAIGLVYGIRSEGKFYPISYDQMAIGDVVKATININDNYAQLTSIIKRAVPITVEGVVRTIIGDKKGIEYNHLLYTIIGNVLLNDKDIILVTLIDEVNHTCQFKEMIAPATPQYVKDSFAATVHLELGQYFVYHKDQRYITNNQSDMEDGVEVECVIEDNIAKVLSIINDNVADFYVVEANGLLGSYHNGVFYALNSDYNVYAKQIIRAYYDTGELCMIRAYNHKTINKIDTIQVFNSISVDAHFPIIKRTVLREYIGDKIYYYISVGKNSITAIGNITGKPQYVVLLPYYTGLKIAVTTPLDYAKDKVVKAIEPVTIEEVKELLA